MVGGTADFHHHGEPDGTSRGKLAESLDIELKWSGIRQQFTGLMPEEDLPPAPNVNPRYRWIWRAWHRLSLDRPYYGGGMGPPVPGNIPWWQLKLWAQHHGLTRSQFTMLDICVRKMDEVYRTWIRDKMEADRKALESQRRIDGPR